VHATREALRTLARIGFEGPLALGLLACALILSIVLLAAVCFDRPTAGRVVRALAWTEAAFLGGAVLLGAALVSASRRSVLGQEHPFLGGLEDMVSGLDESEASLLVVGGGAGLAALVLAVAAATWALRSRAGALRAATWFFAALLPAVTALGIARQGAVVDSVPSNCLAELDRCLADVYAGSAEPLAGARTAVLALAASFVLVLAVAATWDAARLSPPSRWTRWAGAALVLVLGAAAHRATRPLAADAVHPFPLRARGEMDCPVRARSLPPAGPCESWSRGPRVEIAGDRSAIDGYAVSPGDDLSVTFERVLILYRGAPPPVFARFVAPAATPIAAVTPHLRVVHEQLGGGIGIVTALPPQVVRTHTLGDVTPGPRCCATQVRFSENGVPLSQFATWADLAKAAAEAPEGLAVAP
jgi:hypothetical protein